MTGGIGALSIRALLATSRGTVLLSLVVGTIGGASSAALIALINTILTRQDVPRWTLLLGYGALCALVPLTKFAAATLLIRLSQRITYDMRVQLSSSIAAAPLSQLEQLGVSTILAALTDDVSTVSNAVVNIAVLCGNLAVIAGCLVYLGYLSWIVLGGALAFMLIGVVTYYLPVIRANSLFRSARSGQDALLKCFRAVTEGTKELQLHAPRSAAFFSEALIPCAESVRRQTVSGMQAYAAAWVWGQALLFAAIGLLLLWRGNSSAVSAELLTGCVLVALYMIGAIEGVVNALPVVARARVALESIAKLKLPAAEDRRMPSSRHGGSWVKDWKVLEMIGVTYHYRSQQDNATFAFGPFDFTLARGETVFFTGGNGSGKTTCAKLLTGLYRPDSGEIRLDGKLVSDDNRADYRQQFSAVFFDFFLFERFFGLEVRDRDPRVNDYLARLHLDRKVQLRSDALSTDKLSQGQRKRLALLTAYLEDRSIYVFDEWAADQDPPFKEIFYHQLLPELKQRGKSVVVISHDDRFYRVADRVLKLEDGRSVASAKVGAAV